MSTLQALANLRTAVDGFLATVDKAGATWRQPRAPGKWSPSQVVEHVARIMEESANVAAGGPFQVPDPAARCAAGRSAPGVPTYPPTGEVPSHASDRRLQARGGPGDAGSGADACRGGAGTLRSRMSCPGSQ